MKRFSNTVVGSYPRPTKVEDTMKKPTLSEKEVDEMVGWAAKDQAGGEQQRPSDAKTGPREPATPGGQAGKKFRLRRTDRKEQVARRMRPQKIEAIFLGELILQQAERRIMHGQPPPAILIA